MESLECGHSVSILPRFERGRSTVEDEELTLSACLRTTSLVGHDNCCHDISRRLAHYCRQISLWHMNRVGRGQGQAWSRMCRTSARNKTHLDNHTDVESLLLRSSFRMRYFDVSSLWVLLAFVYVARKTSPFFESPALSLCRDCALGPSSGNCIANVNHQT
jgi:hypothetical protein